MNAFTPIDYEAIREERCRLAEEERRAAQTVKLFESIPLRFRGNTFESFQEHYPEQSRIKSIAKRFADSFSERLEMGNCMVFHGKAGTGKTMLSLIVNETVAKAGFSIGYESSLLFLRQLKEKEFESSAAFNNMIESYLRKSLLVIDEITKGVGKGGVPAEWERNLLFTLINARYEKKLCTIAITNSNKAEMIEQLGAPIVDRFSDKGAFFAFNWDSYRK